MSGHENHPTTENAVLEVSLDHGETTLIRYELMMTEHASERSRQRQISKELMMLALLYGRCRHQRGADHYIIGNREIAYWMKNGVDLSAARDVRVVCSMDGIVLTVYRQIRHSRLSRGAPA